MLPSAKPAPLGAPPAAHQPPKPAAPADPNVQQRSLNVRDALSYLDMVKTIYRHHPEVYNRFLDIMKDFKSQKYYPISPVAIVIHAFLGLTRPVLSTEFRLFSEPIQS